MCMLAKTPYNRLEESPFVTDSEDVDLQEEE